MGKKDHILKAYFSENRRFAKLFNATLFDGKDVIDPEKLSEQDSVIPEIVPLKDGSETIIDNSRDIVKVYNNQMELVIIGVENQMKIDYAMPLRVMLYDALIYDRQRKKIQAANKKDRTLTDDEWLSKFKKTDKLIPVITLVVYYGEKEWDGARSLKEMFGSYGKDPLLVQFIPDYPMHLLEVNRIEKLETYGDELLPLFTFIKYQKKRKELENAIHKYENIFSHVDRETYSVIRNMIDLKELDHLLSRESKQEGEINMCEALQEMLDEKLSEGRNEAFMEVAQKMLQEQAPKETIMKVTGLTEKEIEALEDKMQ